MASESSRGRTGTGDTGEMTNWLAKAASDAAVAKQASDAKWSSTVKNRTTNSNNPFGANFVGLIMNLRVNFRIENDLCQAITITKINKGHTAMVASAMNPTSQLYNLPGLGCAEFPASV